MSRLFAVLILAVVGAGCATTHVIVPPAPAITAPDAERVAWAERYSLVPGTGLGDTIGSGEVLIDMGDLKTGIDDPIVNGHLLRLEGYSGQAALSSAATVVTAVAAVAGLIVTPGLEREYGLDDPVAAGVGLGTTVAVVGFVASSLWSNSVNHAMETIRGRIRLAYGHAIEDQLNVEIHPSGNVTARAPIASAPAPSSLPAPLPPVLTSPPPQLAPTPTTEPTTPPTTTTP